MNKAQLIVLWLAGLLVSGILCSTGIKILHDTATYAETPSMGYPFTLVIGTAWAYIAPIIIIGVLREV